MILSFFLGIGGIFLHTNLGHGTAIVVKTYNINTNRRGRVLLLSFTLRTYGHAYVLLWCFANPLSTLKVLRWFEFFRMVLISFHLEVQTINKILYVNDFSNVYELAFLTLGSLSDRFANFWPRIRMLHIELHPWINLWVYCFDPDRIFFNSWF